MEKTFTAVYDGEVFRPNEPIDLTPNTNCVFTIVSSPTSPGKGPFAWEALDQLTGAIDGPEDWSAEHDHYLYGTPKRSRDRTE